MAEFNREEFSLPDFKVVEIPILAAPAPGAYSVAEFDREALEYDHDAIVDRIILTEDTLITENPDPGAGTSILPSLWARWWKDREDAFGDFIPLTSLDCRRPGLSEVDPTVAPAGAGYGQLVWEPKGPKPLRVKYQDSLVVDWENPNVAVAPGFAGGTVHFSAQGYLERSKRPYTLFTPINVAAGAITPAGLVADQTAPTNISRNMTGQDLIIKRFVTTIDSAHYPQLAIDPRIWRHLRIMPRLSGSEEERFAPYRQRAPLVVFGQDVQVNNHPITIDFIEPIEMKRLSCIKWEFRNFNTLAGTQIVGTFVGWRRPKQG